MVLAGAGPHRPGRIETTLDAACRRTSPASSQTHRAALERHGAANVAVVVLDNARGEWLAWEGSGDYFDAAHGGAINGPSMPRQPGSALKPFTYALAFEQGFTPASVLPDVPLALPDRGAGRRLQPAKLRRPLPRSAAGARRRWPDPRTCRRCRSPRSVGVPDLLRFLRRAGFSTFDRTAAHYGLGLTLGNAEVRLDELVAAYCGVRARRRVAAADVSDGSRREPVPTRAARAGLAADRVLDQPTSSPTTTRAPTSSAAAAVWSSRSRSR